MPVPALLAVAAAVTGAAVWLSGHIHSQFWLYVIWLTSFVVVAVAGWGVAKAWAVIDDA